MWLRINTPGSVWWVVVMRIKQLQPDSFSECSVTIVLDSLIVHMIYPPTQICVSMRHDGCIVLQDRPDVNIHMCRPRLSMMPCIHKFRQKRAPNGSTNWHASVLSTFVGCMIITSILWPCSFEDQLPRAAKLEPNRVALFVAHPNDGWNNSLVTRHHRTENNVEFPWKAPYIASVPECTQ